MLGATHQGWQTVSPAGPTGLSEGLAMSFETHSLHSFVTLPQSDRIHRFLSYWMALRGNRNLPQRGDLDPLAIPSVLNGIWLITVDIATDTFHSRLAGEAVNRFFGRTMAGSNIEDALPENSMKPLHAQIRRVRDGECMLLEQGNLLRPDGAHVRGERLLAPFATYNYGVRKGIDHIVGVLIASGPVSRATVAGTTEPARVFEVPLR